MIRKAWDIYESALLLDTFISIENGNINRKNAIDDLSALLRSLGQSRGITIDEKYRNTNGIAMQLNNLQYAWTDGAKGLPCSSKVFYEIVHIYRSNLLEYQRLLSEAKAMTNAKSVADLFCTWLADRVSPAQLSELYQMYPLIDDFCMSRKITDRPLLSIVDIKTVKKVFDTVEQNKVFRFMHRGQTIRISAAARHYLSFITENGSSLAENPLENKPVPSDINAKVRPATVVADVIDAHIDYVDNRNKRGCLWILGGHELQPFVDKCSGKGVVFHYSQSGCRASNGNPAWWTTDEYNSVNPTTPKNTETTQTANPPDTPLVQEQRPAVEQKREQSSIKPVDYNSDSDYSKTTPVGLSYFAERIRISSWQDVYCKVLRCLSDDYDLTGLRGRTANRGERLLWGDKSQTARMKQPFSIGQADLYADIGFGNNTIVKLISTLLKYCRVDYENVIITYTNYESKPTLAIETPVESEPKQTSTPEATDESEPLDLIKRNRNLFFDWLKANPVTKPSHLMTYVSVRQIEKFLEASDHFATSLYAIDRLEDVINLSYQLMADNAFVKLDKDNHGALVEALQLYIDFAKEQSCAGTEQSLPEQEECPVVSTEAIARSRDRYTSILEANFPDGFRPNKAIDRNRFRVYFSETYGEEINDSDEQLINRLLKVGTLRNDRIFVKDEAEQKDLLKEIDDMIIQTFNNGASCIYIDCLFNRFQSDLSVSLHVYDLEAFENVLLSRGNHRYYKRYNYLCNYRCEANPQRDVLNYMKLHHVPVTYDEIASDLWYIPLEKIKQVLVTAIETVNAAPEAYLYAPNLPINEDELKTITVHVRSALLQRPYISDVELMQIIDDHCPSVAMNTSEYPLWGLRNALSFLLRYEFSFRGAIISKKGEEISMAEVFSDFCKRNEHLTVDELKNFASELDTVIYWDSVYEEMVRINHNEFVRKDQLSFDSDRIDTVLDMLVAEAYVPLKSITLFLHFPPLSVSWNSFVLESYVANYSKKYALMHASFSATDCCGAIVRKESGIADYRALLVDVLANNQTWKSKADALELLVRDSYQQRRSYSDIEKVMQEAKAKAAILRKR